MRSQLSSDCVFSFNSPFFSGRARGTPAKAKTRSLLTSSSTPDVESALPSNAVLPSSSASSPMSRGLPNHLSSTTSATWSSAPRVSFTLRSRLPPAVRPCVLGSLRPSSSSRDECCWASPGNNHHRRRPLCERRPAGDAAMRCRTAGRAPTLLVLPALAAWLAVLSGGALASPGVTGPANNESVRFLVFGDWGGLPFYPYTTRIQRNLAKTMAVVAAAKRIDFVLSLGDNFYFKGVRSVDDRRFKARVAELVFVERLILGLLAMVS
ncbi:hypothetical protein HPB49_002696 [Dermacentor silvarum]|uniref:Uncharacterized protein n=1 Tax=Dermacentor silvarum TaxID=543639 RepID=A0ACB8CP79_DERSI|nr:hypothetical protein HPB49_002696 [Dermacentor silvarum]